MKLKTRLITAFVIIVLTPVVLSFAMYNLVGEWQKNQIEQKYGISSESIESLTNVIDAASALTKSTYIELEDIIKEHPDKMEDLEFLGSVNQELKERQSYLIVKKQNSIEYLGKESDLSGAIISHLPDYDTGKEVLDGENGIYLGGDEQVMVKRIQFTFNDGSDGAAFLVTDTSDMIPEIERFYIIMIVGILAILIITAGVLSFWLYKSVTVPLSLMKEAANNIREGNLNYEFKISSSDEMGRLAQDLEEMRIRLKESAEEKLKFDRESKDLISNISHDLKTPVTAIKGYAEGIMDGVADTPEKMDKYVHTIYNKADEMNLLINELTLYSKIDTNRIPYNFSTLSVNNYFNDCAEDLLFELESKNVEFGYFNYVTSDVQIIADAEQVKRVIHNIVNNSLKYMDKDKPKINLRIKDVGDFVQIEVEDNGKGISAKDLTHIFERFYRTDASRNSSKGGSGIGLSIVKKIIEEHGGKIWATSKEDTGTTIFFVLRKYQEVPASE
ncbi:MAG: ATP-binding protein [Suipraeoptans sp.]